MSDTNRRPPASQTSALNRRNILLAGTTLAAASAMASGTPISVAQAQQPQAAANGK
jgi:arylsulfatase